MKLALFLLLALQDPDTEYRDLVRHVLTHMEEFQIAKEMAAELGVDVALYGGSSRDLAFFVRDEIRQGRADELRKRTRFSLAGMLGTRESDIDLIATGREADLQERLNREHPPMGRFFRWEVKPVGKLGNKVERTQGRITVDKILLADTQWNVPDRVLTWHQEGLRDAREGIIRYHRSPGYFTSPEYTAGHHDEPFEVLRAVRFGTGYRDVRFAPGTLETLNAVMEQALQRPPSSLHPMGDNLFTKRLNQNLRKMFLQSRDLARTDDLVRRLRIREWVRSTGFEDGFKAARFTRSYDPEGIPATYEGSDGRRRPVPVDRMAHPLFYHNTRTGSNVIGILNGGFVPSEAREKRAGSGLYLASSEASDFGDYRLEVVLDPDSTRMVDITQGPGKEIWRAFNARPGRPKGSGDPYDAFARTYGYDLILFDARRGWYVLKNSRPIDQTGSSNLLRASLDSLETALKFGLRSERWTALRKTSRALFPLPRAVWTKDSFHQLTAVARFEKLLAASLHDESTPPTMNYPVENKARVYLESFASWRHAMTEEAIHALTKGRIATDVSPAMDAFTGAGVYLLYLGRLPALYVSLPVERRLHIVRTLSGEVGYGVNYIDYARAFAPEDAGPETSRLLRKLEAGFLEFTWQVAESDPSPEARHLAWASALRRANLAREYPAKPVPGTSWPALDATFSRLENALRYERSVETLRRVPWILRGWVGEPRAGVLLRQLVLNTPHAGVLSEVYTVAYELESDGERSKLLRWLKERASQEGKTWKAMVQELQEVAKRDRQQLLEAWRRGTRIMIPEDVRLTPAWVRKHAATPSPQDRAVRTGAAILKGELSGTGQFAAAYAVKESFRALVEYHDPSLLNKTVVGAMKDPMFWVSLPVFSAASHGATTSLSRFMTPGGLASKAAFRAAPLAAGMAAMQLLSGDFSAKNLAISTVSFGTAGVLVRPALGRLGLPGFVLLAAELYLGEKIDGFIHGLLAGKAPRPALKNTWGFGTYERQGVVQKLSEVGDR